MSSSSGTSSPRRSAAIALSTVRTVSMNSKTTVRKAFSASPSSDTVTLVIAAGIRSAGRPDWLTRSITFCANANAGWPVGTSSIDELRDFALFPGLALFPLRQLVIQRYRLPREHRGNAVAELAQQRIGDVVDGERMLRERPRRCGRGTAPAGARHRVPREVRRRCHCAPRRTTRRSPPTGSGAASRGSARSPTDRPCAACPSSRRHRPAARRACGSGAAISLSPAASRACTAGWSGSDDSSTGASSPS